MRQKSISFQLLAPLLAAVALGVLAVYVVLPRLVEGNAVATAIDNAAQTVRQFRVVRQYYSDEVVKKVTSNGAIKADSVHSDPKTIALPTTMLLDVGERLAKEDISISLYSNYPFPNRGDRKLDDFQRDALDFLAARPEQAFSRSEIRGGHQVVRVAIADRMAESCVACHNSRADSPKTDWKVGDTRGVIEVDTDIDGALVAGRHLTFIILLMILGIGAATAGIAVLIIRRVGRRLSSLERTVRLLADGDHRVNVLGSDRADEIGRIATAVQVFKDGLIERERLAAEQAEAHGAGERRARELEALTQHFRDKIEQLVASLSASAGEMESTARSMSATTDHTNRHAETVSAASEQASANVRRVAEDSRELAGSISDIGRKVAQSSQVARGATADAQRTDAAVQALTSRAQKIGEVIAMINDIAVQTNLLALNATIEAARAGEAGKGFAVVASEVKALASQTSVATEEVTTQIAQIQAATEQAVTAIRGIGTTVTEIDEICAAIAIAVEQQNGATQRIAHNVEEAARGVQDAAANISGLRASAHDSGAAAQRVLAAAAAVTTRAGALSQEFSGFIAGVKAL